ncbi:hypothetical protein LSAT2_029760, partial [Lamellibrachia satsuma]
ETRRDLDLACRMNVFEIDHDSKSMRRRLEIARAAPVEAMPNNRNEQWRPHAVYTVAHLAGKVKPLYYYKGATLTPLVGGGTVRRNSEGKRPEKRPGCAGNGIAFGSEGDVNDNLAPNAAADLN